jgi:diguanylate cyclase (GGDEF)-like protein/PAS domain S-box-containing protein
MPEEANGTLFPKDPAFYKDLLDHMSDGVYFVDRSRRILYWNEGAHRLTGYAAEELLGHRCQDDILCHIDGEGNQLCQEGCPLTASMDDGGTHEANVFLRNKQGRRVPVNVRVQPVRDAGGAIVGAIEIFSDDSAQNEARRRAEALKRLAFFDHLTQLPNRRYLEMSMHTAQSEFEVHRDPFGLLVMDLDGLKQINDTFGHGCGDLALQETAKALAGAMRPVDAVGRWGGDEFLAIVRNVDAQSLKTLAERCVEQVRKASTILEERKGATISVSVGAALARLGEMPAELLGRADALMYQGKWKGRNRAEVE